MIRLLLIFAWATLARAEIAVRWVASGTGSNKYIVVVTGLPDQVRQAVPAERPDPIGGEPDGREKRLGRDASPYQLSVYADQGDLKADMSVPPMAGRYWTELGRLCFEPQFPLERSVNYRAVVRLDGKAAPIVANFKLPAENHQPTTVITQIYPSADSLPENLLKFYVHFSAPMSRGRIYDHIHLLDERGKAVELPFLEIDEELWAPSMKRLTLFIDPGRIKRGVKPLEDVGPALEQGKQFTLVIDKDWQDSSGQPMKEAFRKTFRVGPPDREPPDPTRWKIDAPRAGTREPLRVSFPKPMDHALALRMIRVTNVDGTNTLENQERLWTFIPSADWRSGPYKLQVQTTIEDLAGNNIGKPFEVDVFESVQRSITNDVVEIPFNVN